MRAGRQVASYRNRRQLIIRPCTRKETKKQQWKPESSTAGRATCVNAAPKPGGWLNTDERWLTEEGHARVHACMRARQG